MIACWASLIAGRGQLRQAEEGPIALGAVPPELHREDATLDGPHLPDVIRVLHDLGDHGLDLVDFGNSIRVE